MTALSKIADLPEKYTAIIERIDQSLAKATTDAEVYNKSSSQFKTVTLDVTDLTPISTSRHLLAVIQQTRYALIEADIGLRRHRLDLARKRDEYESASGYDRDALQIDMDELTYKIEALEASSRGALRRLSHALGQYEDILGLLNKPCITEADFEEDQPRYHIMTAFNQALCAARAHGGIIDEGNHIYLSQLGINGAVAQAEVTNLLRQEYEAMERGEQPTQQMVMDWLNRLADEYAEAPGTLVRARYMSTLDPLSLIDVLDER